MDQKKQLNILDCSLRDGGYYTNWDFDDELLKAYLEAMNKLPVDIIEIGYRSKARSDYKGAYFYLPELILKKIQALTTKELAIILNEKEVRPEDLPVLLDACKERISLVRLAVAPENMDRALFLAAEVKRMGFTVSFNLMYASCWEKDFPSEENLRVLNRAADIFYVVDSYGALFPETVSLLIKKMKKHLKIRIGFHGHNNLEMALANSLAAMEAGADAIDSTICGMGRGAGNLKTELLLTVLHQKQGLPVDFDLLNSVITSFQKLKEQYLWGGNLAYMVSGAFSLPQDKVISAVKKRYFSLNSIVAEERHSGEIKVPNYGDFFPFRKKYKSAMLIGGGFSPAVHAKALLCFLNENPDVPVIHASSKNIYLFNDLKNEQYHCIPGMEGKRFEKILNGKKKESHYLILPPVEFSVNEYVPRQYRDDSSRLQKLDFAVNGEVSATAMALQIIRELGVDTVFVSGYDGYGEKITKEEAELFLENEEIFKKAADYHLGIFSVTPCVYNIPSRSVYTLIK